MSDEHLIPFHLTLLNICLISLAVLFCHISTKQPASVQFGTVHFKNSTVITCEHFHWRLYHYLVSGVA